jgi:EpsI family protein
VADLGEVAAARQYMFAAMLPLTVLAVLGRPIARALVFPLAFILFGVPFGEVFVPSLINITANFTIDALVATGIPVLREGNTFTIPTGNWSVVEACSGVRYLISSVTLGCLYAYLSFRSRKRQAVFIALSMVVPIIANGMRAYMIVMIGHLSGMTLAVGVDHIIYGWVFFGLVMFLLFWVGSYWREDRAPGQPGTPPAVPERADRSVLTRPVLAAAVAVALTIGIWPAYGRYVETSQFNPVKPNLSTLALAWQPGLAFTSWNAEYAAPTAVLRRYYQQGNQQVGMTVFYYRNQQQTGAKLISSVNVLAGDKDGVHRVSQATRTETFGARTLQVRESVLSDGAQRMLVWSWYWIDGVSTTSDAKGKLLQVREKLLHGRDDGAAVLLFTRADEKAEPARAALRAFAAANLDAIESGLAAQVTP